MLHGHSFISIFASFDLPELNDIALANAALVSVIVQLVQEGIATL